MRHFLERPQWHLLAQLVFEAASCHHQLQGDDFDVIRVESVSTKSGKINKSQLRNKIVHVKFDFFDTLSPRVCLLFDMSNLRQLCIF